MESTPRFSASIEDYLEAIYVVVGRNQAALPRDIRKILNVSRSSVSGALKHLAAMGLVRHESYGVITLTERGEEIAREVARKHGILKTFLVNVLSVEDAEADEAACGIEHVISDTILERFLAYAEYASRCPNIGTKWSDGAGFLCDANRASEICAVCGGKGRRNGIDASIEKESAMTNQTEVKGETLRDIAPGNKATVVRVAGKGALRGRLLDLGVTKGTVVTVEKIAPLGDPIEIKLKGYRLSLRKDEAEMIAVRPFEPGDES